MMMIVSKRRKVLVYEATLAIYDQVKQLREKVVLININVNQYIDICDFPLLNPLIELHIKQVHPNKNTLFSCCIFLLVFYMFNNLNY